VWDRAALVALPLALRVPYAVHLQSIAPAGTKLLLNVFEYDPSAMSGPPFSVTESEVREHFTNSKIELLEERDALDAFPRFRDLGNTYWTVRTFLIQW
jgi:thiopurine S-methyltransferase